MIESKNICKTLLSPLSISRRKSIKFSVLITENYKKIKETDKTNSSHKKKKEIIFE